MNREQMIAWLTLEGYILTEVEYYWVAKNPYVMRWLGITKNPLYVDYPPRATDYDAGSPVDLATRPADIPDEALRQIVGACNES